MAFLNDGLFVPVLFLALLGWLVPKGLSMVIPEGVKPLILIAFLSSVLMCVLSAILFFGLYLFQGITVAKLMEEGLFANLVFFGRLGLSTAIVWAPIMLLSVAGLPRHWVKETW